MGCVLIEKLRKLYYNVIRYIVIIKVRGLAMRIVKLKSKTDINKF